MWHKGESWIQRGACRAGSCRIAAAAVCGQPKQEQFSGHTLEGSVDCAEAILDEECILTKLVHCTYAGFNACWAIWLFAIIGFPFP